MNLVLVLLVFVLVLLVLVLVFLVPLLLLNGPVDGPRGDDNDAPWTRRVRPCLDGVPRSPDLKIEA